LPRHIDIDKVLDVEIQKAPSPLISHRGNAAASRRRSRRSSKNLVHPNQRRNLAIGAIDLLPSARESDCSVSSF